MFGKNIVVGVMIVFFVVFLFEEIDGFVEVFVGNDEFLCLSGVVFFVVFDDILVMCILGFSSCVEGFIEDIYLGKMLNNKNCFVVKV